MGIRFLRILNAKQIMRRALSTAEEADVPRGHMAIYVGGTKKQRFVIPISYLKNDLFQKLLSQAEEEFGFQHSMGGLTIPCSEKAFIDVTSSVDCF